MDTLIHENKLYPLFQSKGNAAQFAIPFAKYIYVREQVMILDTVKRNGNCQAQLE